MGCHGLTPNVEHGEQAGEAIVLSAVHPANHFPHPGEREDVHRPGSPVLLGLPPKQYLQVRLVLDVNLESNRANVRLEPRGLLLNVGYLIGARRLALSNKRLEAPCDIEALRDLRPPVELLEDGLIGKNGIEVPTAQSTATKERARGEGRLAPRNDALIVGEASSNRTSSREGATLKREESRLSFILMNNSDGHVASGGGDDLRELGSEEGAAQ
jgi:hypothetical protein